MATKPIQTCVFDDPKDTFENALALMRPESRLRKAIVARRRPIAARPDAQPTEKRALTDAARALAQLWKISPHLVR